MIYELIIIGGGPAGVAAGVYASRKRISTLLLTDTFGGQALNSDSIENWIGFEKVSGFEMAQIMEKHLRTQDHIDIKDGVRVTSLEKNENGFVVTTSGNESFTARTVLLALGSSYKKLDVPGEKEFEGKGVFYCSICDAPLMKGKDVIVVGGGNSAFEAALDLLPYAQTITILNRTENFKGDTILLDRLRTHENVRIFTNTIVEQFSGSTLLSAATCRNVQTNDVFDIPVSGAFVAIGYNPNSGLVDGIADRNAKNQIIVDHKTQKTSYEGLWAVGDITDSLYHQINTAMGDGVTAVLNIYDFLRK